MFQTFEHDRITFAPLDADENAWTLAELMINVHWLFADCQITEGEVSVNTSYILSNPKQLNELQTKQNVFIKTVYIVSPPYMNCTECWKMDQVVQVSTGVTFEDNYKINIEIYELNNGEQYYSEDVRGRENTIKDIKVVFSI